MLSSESFDAAKLKPGSSLFWRALRAEDNKLQPACTAIIGAKAYMQEYTQRWEPVHITGVSRRGSGRSLYVSFVQGSRTSFAPACDLVLALNHLGTSQRVTEALGALTNDSRLYLLPDQFNGDYHGWMVVGGKYSQHALKSRTLTESMLDMLNEVIPRHLKD